ncbi:hypothetical protein D3C78_1688210 [compost metagenome]
MASAIRSASVLTGSSLFTLSTSGLFSIRMMGARSFCGLYGISFIKDGFTAIGARLPVPMV